MIIHHFYFIDNRLYSTLLCIMHGVYDSGKKTFFFINNTKKCGKRCGNKENKKSRDDDISTFLPEMEELILSEFICPAKELPVEFLFCRMKHQHLFGPDDGSKP